MADAFPSVSVSHSAMSKLLTTALTWYRIAAYITGILLLLLTVEMIAKYGYGTEVEAMGSQGFLAFVPTGTVEAVNLSSAILIAHGWFYVVYLFTCFRVWSIIRWPLWRFGWLASGGLFPFLSFVIEHQATRVVRGAITDRMVTS
jgi:integral membrane protein